MKEGLEVKKQNKTKHAVHSSFHLSTMPASAIPRPTLPSPVGFFPKKVLEVMIWLPRAIRAACLPVSIYLESNFLWLSTANDEELSRNQLRTSLQTPLVKTVSGVHLQPNH